MSTWAIVKQKQVINVIACNDPEIANIAAEEVGGVAVEIINNNAVIGSTTEDNITFVHPIPVVNIFPELDSDGKVIPFSGMGEI